MNQVRDLLECGWPAVLDASGAPFRSAPWCAAVSVALDRSCGDLARVHRLGPARFEAAVRRELPQWGATRPCLRIVRAVWSATADPSGVAAHRPGALERAGLAMADWHDTRERLAGTEQRMVAVLDDLGLTGLVTTIAGLCPRDNASGEFQGKTPISGRGRPGLRVAAWRAVWAAMPNNDVMAAKFTPPDHPRRQPARPPASPHRVRRRAAALDPRRHHPARGLGPGHRRQEHAAAAGRMNAAH